MDPTNAPGNEAHRKNTAVIIDVDNTIFDQSKRKTVILQDKLDQRAISIDLVRSDFSLYSIMQKLSNDTQKAFWEAFFGTDHYRTEKGYTIEIYPHCAEVITSLSSKYQIIYLTARPDMTGQREELVKELEDFGCPTPNGDDCRLFLMPNEGDLNSNELFQRRAREFKLARVKELTRQTEVRFGIGDTEDDMTAYKDSSLVALQFIPPGFPNLKFANSDLAFTEWGDIGEAIRLVDGGEDNIELNELRMMHISEYGGWLSDLDAKSRLLLIINTVLFAVSLTLMARADGALDYIFYTGAMISLLAMAFCIRSFSSRRIRGGKAGRTASFGWLGQMITCLFGGKPVPPNTPIHSHRVLKQRDLQAKKIAHIQFFMDNYDTLDPSAVKNLRLFELRSLNYIKIFGEMWGRRFTFLAMIVIGIGVTIGAFSEVSKVSLGQDNGAIEHSIKKGEGQSEIGLENNKRDGDDKGNKKE